MSVSLIWSTDISVWLKALRKMSDLGDLLLSERNQDDLNEPGGQLKWAPPNNG